MYRGGHMIGSLVYYDYAEDPMNICVVLDFFNKEKINQQEDLYLIYDFNYRDYYYASIEEMEIICN
jgi:hypothetical protein